MGLFAAFDGFDFTDRHGITRTFYGCSTVGVFEFFELMAEIETRLNSAEEGESWQSIYHRDKRVQWLIQKALTLNGIDPDSVTLTMTESLLLRRKTADGFDVGWLVELNRPVGAQSNERSEAATLEQVVGAIATHSASLKEAFEVAETIPARQVQAVMKAKNDLVAPPDQKQQNRATENQRKAREQLQKLRERAVTNA